jgi:hypothetical protein
MGNHSLMDQKEETSRQKGNRNTLKEWRRLMHIETRSVIKVVAYISLFVLFANGGTCPEISSNPFGGTYVNVDTNSGLKETWSIEPRAENMTVTIKREQLNGGHCEIIKFDATVDDPVALEASGSLNGLLVTMAFERDPDDNFGIFVRFGEDDNPIFFKRESEAIQDPNLSCP